MPDKGGYGLFARQEFAVGDFLIQEKPLFVQSSAGWSTATTQEAAMVMADNQANVQIPLLPAAKRAAVMGLSDVHSAAPSPWGIARTNCIPTGDDSALFALSARINHSCVPNARWLWRADLGCLVIIAMRPLKPGEEVTCEYIKRYAARAARIQRLETQFHFTCACPLCVGPVDEAADERLELVQSLIDEMPEACRRDHAHALTLSERTLALLVESGMDTPVAMGTCHYEAFQLARATGKKAEAMAHLEQACGLTKLSDGVDSPLALKYAALAAGLAR